MEISVKTAATRARVQQRILAAASMYESIWELVKHDIGALYRDREIGELWWRPFFSLDYSGRAGPQLESHIVMSGELDHDARTGGFVLKVVENNVQTEEQTVVWSRNSMVDVEGV